MDSLEAIITTLILFGLHLHKLGKEKEKEKQVIRIGISEAFHATESYYRLLENGKNRDTEIECNIAEKWEYASFLIEPFDKALSKRLSLKGNFWRGGAAWSEKEISEAGIQLSRVRGEGITLFQRN